MAKALPLYTSCRKTASAPEHLGCADLGAEKRPRRPAITYWALRRPGAQWVRLLALPLFILLNWFIAVDRAVCAPFPREITEIVVYKAQREMRLLAGRTTVRRYAIALGSNPTGHKEREGDGRTPEGTYSIIGRNAASSYHLSLRISYPNEADVERARRLGVPPGSDIMIHGLPNGLGALGAAHRLRDWTAGCIAVTNAEIEEIWRLVPDGTKVRILP